jgi:hypothetical protein
LSDSIRSTDLIRSTDFGSQITEARVKAVVAYMQARTDMETIIARLHVGFDPATAGCVCSHRCREMTMGAQQVVVG